MHSKPSIWRTLAAGLAGGPRSCWGPSSPSPSSPAPDGATQRSGEGAGKPLPPDRVVLGGVRVRTTSQLATDTSR